MVWVFLNLAVNFSIPRMYIMYLAMYKLSFCNKRMYLLGSYDPQETKEALAAIGELHLQTVYVLNICLLEIKFEFKCYKFKYIIHPFPCYGFSSDFY